MDLLTVAGGAVVVAATGILVYWFGYLFSVGYHRGKREFVAKMIQDCSKEK